MSGREPHQSLPFLWRFVSAEFLDCLQCQLCSALVLLQFRWLPVVWLRCQLCSWLVLSGFIAWQLCSGVFFQASLAAVQRSVLSGFTVKCIVVCSVRLHWPLCRGLFCQGFNDSRVVVCSIRFHRQLWMVCCQASMTAVWWSLSGFTVSCVVVFSIRLHWQLCSGLFYKTSLTIVQWFVPSGFNDNCVVVCFVKLHWQLCKGLFC